MIHLNDKQLRDAIVGIEHSLAHDERKGRGETARARHRRKQLADYRAELAARQPEPVRSGAVAL